MKFIKAPKEAHQSLKHIFATNAKNIIDPSLKETLKDKHNILNKFVIVMKKLSLQKTSLI